MRAEQLPLQGKHYGTVIRLYDDELEHGTEIKIWLPYGQPSAAEIEHTLGITADEYARNVKVPGGWGGEPIPAQEEWPQSQHYQSFLEAEFCRRLVEAINR